MTKDQISEELFSEEKVKGITPKQIPLAERVRPTSLAGFVGQEKLLQKDSILRNIIENDELVSLIFWGPPGSGKTTLARIIANKTHSRFISFSAVLSGIPEVRRAMEQAEFFLRTRNKKTILFIDEIHRFSKSQQDAFLPFIERGIIALIGATTENPSFELIPPLLSRCKVIVLDWLSDQNIYTIISRTFDNPDAGISGYKPMFDKQLLGFLSTYAGGDARVALNAVELIIKAFGNRREKLTVNKVKKLLEKNSLFYDKKGEEHYNLISALHKSLRGSDVNAALYWLARMLESGENPLYIARRLVRFASEDIGLADNNALSIALAAKDAVHFIGMPEASNALAQAVIYLASAPKSNSVYKAYEAAAKEARHTSHHPVPLHIRNAPTPLMKELEYGKDYKYAHNYEGHYAYQKYFPDDMKERVFFHPEEIGFEKEIKRRINWWKELKKRALRDEENKEKKSSS
jgi:putative ATPase